MAPELGEDGRVSAHRPSPQLQSAKQAGVLHLAEDQGSDEGVGSRADLQRISGRRRRRRRGLAPAAGCEPPARLKGAGALARKCVGGVRQ